MTLRVTTPFGTRGTRKDLEEALDGIQLAADDDVFVVVEHEEREGFLQMRRLTLEKGRDGRLYRAKVPDSLRALFRDFAEGRPDWDRGIEWIDVTDERKRVFRQGWRIGLAILLVALGFAAARILPLLF